MKKVNELLNRIESILTISELGLVDLNDLAVRCGILPNTLTQAIRRGSLGPENVRKFHDKLGVNPEYLKSGKLPILVKKVPLPQKSEQADILDHPLVKSYVSELNTLRKYVDILERENERLRGGK